MHESVIFALRSGNQVLCEHREYLGEIRQCILGESIEAEDRNSSHYIHTALRREAREELGIDVNVFREIGDFTIGRTVFHVAFVDSGSGDIPDVNADNNNTLEWVSLETLIPSIELLPLKEIFENSACT
jgi:8-oxo-dGTP pyrophosphatase MutT (NUDIX family)